MMLQWYCISPQRSNGKRRIPERDAPFAVDAEADAGYLAAGFFNAAGLGAAEAVSARAWSMSW
jgi:hypothetical protein